MTKLEELIKELCPNGVEYVALGKVTHLLRGKRLTKMQLLGDGKYPVYHGSLVPLGYYNEYNREGDTVIVVNTGGIGGVGYSETPFWCSDGCFCVANSPKIVNKYLYYVLVGYTDYLIARTRVGGVPTIDQETVLSIQIPLPPLAVQREIVRILDKFTLYSQELAAELAARKKQYEFYRDKLLSFNNLTNGGGYNLSNLVRIVKLGEIATDVYRGFGITREQVAQSGTPCVRYGEIYTTYHVWFDRCVSYVDPAVVQNPKYFEHGDILFTITGESVEDIAKSVAYVGHDRCLAGGDIVVMKHKQNPKYLAYALSTFSACQQKSKGKIKSKVVHSNVPSILNIEIPLPPLDIQERIVRVLDNFDSICSDFGIGLPAEIEKRQQQYEFYRDKLLTFGTGSATIFTDRQTDRQTDRAD